jgi:hypothetical protein
MRSSAGQATWIGLKLENLNKRSGADFIEPCMIEKSDPEQL